jgi:excisionase family DNA binding protein
VSEQPPAPPAHWSTNVKRRKAWRKKEQPAQVKSITDDPLMTRAELAEYLHVSASTIARWKSDGTRNPPEVNMGGRMIRYRKSEIDAWLASGADFHPAK